MRMKSKVEGRKSKARTLHADSLFLRLSTFALRPAERGSALILSLWALLLLSASVFAWVKFIDQNITLASEANALLDAKALAHSGVAVALHENVSRTTPLLHAKFGANRKYDVQLTSEAGKLNLNWLLQGAIMIPTPQEAAQKLVIFKRYLERRGLSFQERERLVDCLLDWLDNDNVHRINGAEEEPNYHPPNRGAFISVEEIVQIKGSKPLVSKPGWKDDLTIHSEPGTVDLQSAPLSVLEVLPNIGDPNAQRFLQIRQGLDKTDGTADDRIFKSVEEALQYLNIGGLAKQQLSPYVTVEPKPAVVRIISIGQSGKVNRQVEAVARRVGGGQASFLLWKEL